MKNISALKPLATAALALCSALAHADVYVDVDLSDFHVQLIDFNPGDGIAPSLQLNNVNREVQTWASLEQGGVNPVLIDNHGTGFGSPLTSTQASNGVYSVSSSISGDLLAGTLNLNAHAVGTTGNSYTVSETTLDLQSFTLAPFTIMLISGHESIKSRPGADPIRAGADAISLEFIGGDDQGATGSYSANFFTGNGADVTRESDFTLQYTNPFAQPIQGGGLLRLETFVYVSSVPEPAEAMLLLSGLAGLSALARRRRA